MKIIAHIVFVCYSSLTLTACSSFYPPWNSPRDYPVNYNVINNPKASIMTMTDELRSVIIIPGAVNGINSDFRICPEPPADVADNIANSFKSALVASEKSPESKIDTQFSGEKISSSVLASILTRSQGLELFRDGANALCLAWLNDVYNNGDLNRWRDDFRYLLLISSQLIDKELNRDSLNDGSVEKTK
ncbi:hypothetical protein ACWKX9_23270 [Enterobacter asburiae]